jgi:CHASE2 domain-containing sensor protein/class 3 adenylate cyclase
MIFVFPDFVRDATTSSFALDLVATISYSRAPTYTISGRNMSDQLQPDGDLAIAHVLFIDIVGYSKLATDQQKDVVQQLNRYVRDSEQFRRADTAGKLIRMPTGDGVALAFFTSPDAPVRCAIEISKAVRNSPALHLRMGIHSGPVDQLSDVNERSNLAGTGINIAQRIMNCGDAGHILLSQRVADDLIEYTRWRSQLHELGEVKVKHGVGISVFNLYTDEIGNPEVPQSLSATIGRKPTQKARGPVRSQRLLALICVSCTAVVMSLRFVPAVPVLSQVWGHEQAWEDWLLRTGRRTSTHPELVFAAISTKSLAGPEKAKAGKDRMLQLMAEHPFPWSREVWARLLDRLFEAGARLVIFDLVFNQPNEGDQIFRAALDRYQDRVVMGAYFDLENGNELISPNANLIPPPAQADDRVGYVNYWVDKQDGMLRAARFFTSERQLAGQKASPSDRWWSSLAARAMEKLGRFDEVPHDLRDHLIRFSATEAYQPYPIWEIADPDMWHSKYSDGEFFEGKIVIVGASAPKLGNVINDPISAEIKGPVMHLNVIAATMDHEFLRKLPVAIDVVIVAVFGLLAWLLLGFIRRWLMCLLSFLGLGVAYLLLAFLLYNVLGTFVPIFPPLLTLLVCGFLGFVAQQLPNRGHNMVHR